MSKRLFVAGLPWAVTDQQLSELFSKYGEITSVNVIIDKFTGRSKGFGFVEFAKDEDADKAMKELNDSELEGRKLVVNVARPMENRSFENRKYDRKGGHRDRY